MAKEKDYLKNIDGAERRYITAPVTIEHRADGDDGNAVIEGAAALFNNRTMIGSWFEEEVMPGAFDDVLNSDVRCLFNHNPNYVLARSNKGKGTLNLSITEEGFNYSYTTPNRSYALDLQDAISKGDVSQSSFSFKVKEDKWMTREGKVDLRQIIKFEQVFDVSPVTYPAYQDTTVAKRSHDAFETENEKRNTPTIKTNLSVYEAQVLINKNNS